MHNLRKKSDVNDQDKEWFLMLTKAVKPGGSWAVPRSRGIYRLEHDKQLMTQLTGETDESIEWVAEACGWTVEQG